MSVVHKKDWGPGFRWFHCEYCDHLWDERSRDCQSPSISVCPNCNEIASPYGYEKHFEWPTDMSGNLLEDKNE